MMIVMENGGYHSYIVHGQQRAVMFMFCDGDSKTMVTSVNCQLLIVANSSNHG